LNLVERSARLGDDLIRLLESQIPNSKFQIAIRGQGLLAGLELRRAGGLPAKAEVFRAVKAMLGRGFILLPEGEHANVISFTPPLTITKAQLAKAANALAEILTAEERG
jgi:4-aminobutyrate aminotransferase-like enzyme